jgi:hypothetical protein
VKPTDPCGPFLLAPRPVPTFFKKRWNKTGRL